MAKGKEVKVIERYLPASANAEMAELVQENIGGSESITPFDLERVGIPTGGAMQFLMPDGDGSKTFEAVIVAWANARAYWPNAEFAGGEPPACSSNNGVVAVGNPGGVCATCPFAQFGTSPKAGGGQACKAMRRMLLLVPGRVLPTLLTLPPTSLKGCRTYFVKLVSRMLPYYAIVTRFSLEAAQNAAGIKYGKVTMEQARPLEMDELEEVKSYSASAKAILNSIKVEATDYDSGGVEL